MTRKHDLTDTFFVSGSDTGCEIVAWADKIESLGWALHVSAVQERNVRNQNFSAMIMEYATAISSVLGTRGKISTSFFLSVAGIPLTQGSATVSDNFLVTRHLREYLTLMFATMHPGMDRIEL